MKIAFCVAPMTTDCKVWFAFSLAKTRWPQGSQVALINTTGQWARNGLHELMKLGLNTGAEWIIYAGPDVGWKPNDISRLIEHDKDIIGGWACGRLPPFLCHAADDMNEAGNGFRPVKNPQERIGIEKICSVGGELIVFKSTVFSKIPEPWFYGQDMLIPETGRLMTEDYYFAKRAAENGVEIWVDWDVKLIHHADGLVTYDGKVVEYRGEMV